VAVHPSGHIVCAARSEYAAGDGVAVFKVNSDGTLTEAPGSPYSTQSGPQALMVDPVGNYLYVADGSGYIDIFKIDTVADALNVSVNGNGYAGGALNLPYTLSPGQTMNVNVTLRRPPPERTEDPCP
jgi:DNA-binding beta-propeller fold protein YncE